MVRHDSRNRIIITMLALALVMSLAAGCSSPSSDRADVIQAKSLNVRLSEDQRAEFLQAFRDAMSTGHVEIPATLDKINALGVTLEAFLPPEKPVLAAVANPDFEKAFKAAVKRVSENPTFKSKMKDHMDQVRLKVGVIKQIRPMKITPDNEAKSLNYLRRRAEIAIDGFILVDDGKFNYQLPEEVLYRGFGMRGERRYTGKELHRRQLRALGRDAGMGSEGWKKGSLYAFRTLTYIENAEKGGEPIYAYRAKNMLPQMDAEMLKWSATMNADYLADAVQPDGTFNYIYYPEENKYEEKSYSIVRHAGSVYGLFDAYNRLGDKKYYEAGRRAMDYLLKFAEFPEQTPEIAIIKHQGSSKLGTNALAAMAYAVMPEEFMTEQDKKWAAGFAESIVYFMMPEKGLFYTTYQQALKKKPPRKQALYFPGEAMLALVRIYERDGDPKWFAHAKDIAPGQEELWKNDGHERVGDYCWVGQAFARMARLETDPALAQHFRELGYSHADAVILHQFGSKENPRLKHWYRKDYLGGADNSRPPRTTPTSARGESLSENYLTAVFFNDEEKIKEYGEHALWGVHFCTNNQYTAQNSWFLPYPDKAKGGIRGSLYALDIRIDYNQHELSTTLNTLGVSQAEAEHLARLRPDLKPENFLAKPIPEKLVELGVTNWHRSKHKR
ncbi:hypothetical protein KDL45_02635 [bacterium]|nr:hypothetical protein [bacterium]